MPDGMNEGPDAGPALAVEGVSKNFGGVRAVAGVSTAVRKGEIFAVIGPNGAGKTTLLNMVSGFYKPDEGAILFRERDIGRLKPSQIAELGIARTFQNIALFRGLTVLDNLMLGRHVRLKSGVFASPALLGPGAEGGNPPSPALRGDHRLPEALRPAQDAGRRRWPTASRSASSWAARSRRTRPCCCWTSRWRA